MKSTKSSIIIFSLLMLFGALVLIGREREISTYEYGEAVVPGSDREVVFESSLGPIFERDAQYVYCVGDDASYEGGDSFKEVILSDEPAYFGVAYIEEGAGGVYDWYYSFDRTTLYFNCQKVEGVNPNNMVMFKYNFGDAAAEPLTYVYADGNIYYQDRLFMEASSSVFEEQPELRSAIENTVFATE